MPRQGTPDETSKGRKCAPIAGDNSLKKHSTLVTMQIKPVCENLDDCIYNDMEVKSELFEPEAANSSGNQFSGAVNHEAPAHDSLGGPTRLLIFKPAGADVASPSGHLVSVGRVGNTSSKAKVKDGFGGAVDFKKGLPSTPEEVQKFYKEQHTKIENDLQEIQQLADAEDLEEGFQGEDADG
ncbi:hypothetical protein WAI453_001539 [Rhynchosporium graminicola]